MIIRLKKQNQIHDRHLISGKTNLIKSDKGMDKFKFVKSLRHPVAKI